MPNESLDLFIARVTRSAHGFAAVEAQGVVIGASYSLGKSGRASYRFTAHGKPVGKAVVANLLGA